mgnify:FL=1
MRCTLMNKNKEVLIAEYNETLKVFTDIYEVKNIDCAPLIVYNNYLSGHEITAPLTEWFKGRGIPSWRDDLDLLLSRLGITTPDELLDKAFGLSLSDQYFIKQSDSIINYKDINFFENDFETLEFTNATFSDELIGGTNINLISPNNTTDGKLKKTWIIENNKRYLLKGAYKNEVMQPFNEVLASLICQRLGFNHVTYTIGVINNKIVSKCECFINSDTELIPASQILANISEKTNAYEEYIKILEEKDISMVREKLENMFILDYLMLNEDRHLNNFGVIRNVNTLKWLDIAPIFDNGQSLNIIDYNDDEVIINGQGRFFYSVMDFDTIISKVKNIKRFDLAKLDGMVEEFSNLLRKYQSVTKMTDRRINKLCNLLATRIARLDKIINESNN